jgi:hypothetical protein
MTRKGIVLSATAAIVIGGVAHGVEQMVPPTVPGDIEVQGGFKPVGCANRISLTPRARIRAAARQAGRAVVL